MQFNFIFLSDLFCCCNSFSFFFFLFLCYHISKSSNIIIIEITKFKILKEPFIRCCLDPNCLNRLLENCTVRPKWRFVPLYLTFFLCFLSFFLRIFLSLFLFFFPPIFVSFFLPFFLCIFLCIFLSVLLSFFVFLSVYLFINLFLIYESIARIFKIARKRLLTLSNFYAGEYMFSNIYKMLFQMMVQSSCKIAVCKYWKNINSLA